jgi:hypothetical protein
MAQLVAAGVPHSKRHVQRLCQGGLFDAKKLPGGSGDEWFIAPDSVPKAIGDLRAIQERRARRAPSQHTTSEQVAWDVPRKMGNDTAGHSAPERAAPDPKNREQAGTTENATSRYVVLLERDNEFLRDQVKKKDDQITDLSKRFGETQTLLGAMQRMLAPLLGQRDPFTTPESREVQEASNA